MNITHVSQPMELVGFDIMGPYPRSKLLNKFILVIVDYFSKWTEVIPMRNSNAKVVATHIEKFFTTFGVPIRVISDNGPQFISSIYKKMCNIWKTKISHTSYYHPQSDLVERFNRNLKNMIRAFVENDHTNWDRHLPQFALALRTSVSATTGYTPSKLFLSREIKLPWDAICSFNQENNKENLQSIDDNVKSLDKEMEEIYKFVNTYSEKMKQKQKKYYDQGTNYRSFEIGDSVKIKSHPQSELSKNFTAKFATPWRGPYFVKEKLGNLVYELCDSAGNSIGRYNVVNIGKYYCKDQPDENYSEDDESDNKNDIIDNVHFSDAGVISENPDSSEESDEIHEHRYFTRSKNKGGKTTDLLKK